MLPVLAYARPRPSFLAGVHSTQTHLARARPHPNVLVGDHLYLQTVPLSKVRPEMFPGPVESPADVQIGHDARDPKPFVLSLTLMLRLSMAILITIARLSTLILMFR